MFTKFINTIIVKMFKNFYLENPSKMNDLNFENDGRSIVITIEDENEIMFDALESKQGLINKLISAGVFDEGQIVESKDE